MLSALGDGEWETDGRGSLSSHRDRVSRVSTLLSALHCHAVEWEWPAVHALCAVRPAALWFDIYIKRGLKMIYIFRQIW